MAAYLGASTDRISHLPSGITEEILCRLPIRDAVRTSILSSIWRYKWTLMPSLNFKDKSCFFINDDKLVKVINQCLRLHQGSIRKFSVRSIDTTNIYRWSSFLSTHPIEELQLWFKIPDFRFPSDLFNCKKLTHLELRNCKLDLPCTFEGFLNLKTLTLIYVEINIEMIVSTSPLLESLTLLMPRTEVEVITISAPKLNYLCLQLYCHNEQVVTISAPKLNYLCLKLHSLFVLDKPVTTIHLEVNDQFKPICLKNVIPDDEEVMNDTDQRDCNLIKLLGGTPTKYLGAPQTRFHHLKVMDVSFVSLEDREEVLHLLEMLKSAPNLEKFVIKPTSFDATRSRVGSNFWPEEHPQGREFMKLKVFQMEEISCVAGEIEFAKIILCNSPVLEEMAVSYYVGRKQKIENYMQPLRAFTRATITFSQID